MIYYVLVVLGTVERGKIVVHVYKYLNVCMCVEVCVWKCVYALVNLYVIYCFVRFPLNWGFSLCLEKLGERCVNPKVIVMMCSFD